MTRFPSASAIPQRGKFARVQISAALDDADASHGRDGFPPGVFVGRPCILILSHGARASVLRFAAADDCAKLALALLELADTMHAEAEQAAAAAEAGLARVLADREGAGNA
jgi:hypothetical protein